MFFFSRKPISVSDQLTSNHFQFHKALFLFSIFPSSFFGGFGILNFFLHYYLHHGPLPTKYSLTKKCNVTTIRGLHGVGFFSISESHPSLCLSKPPTSPVQRFPWDRVSAPEGPRYVHDGGVQSNIFLGARRQPTKSSTTETESFISNSRIVLRAVCLCRLHVCVVCVELLHFTIDSNFFIQVAILKL